MKSLDAFRNEVNENQDSMAGDLNIGISDNIIWDKEAQLPRAFQEFSAIGSEVDLTLYVLSPDEIEHRLLDGRLHVGISCVMHKLASLSYEHLFDEVNYLYCGREHPLFNVPDRDISTADLVRSQYVKKGYAVNSDLQQANTAMGKRVVGFHVEAFALLVLSGRYIGFLPEHYAAIWREKGEVRKLHPKRYEAVVNFSVMTAQGRPQTVAQTAFLNILRKATALPPVRKNSLASAVA